jgi:hypothetical protein
VFTSRESIWLISTITETVTALTIPHLDSHIVCLYLQVLDQLSALSLVWLSGKYLLDSMMLEEGVVAKARVSCVISYLILLAAIVFTALLLQLAVRLTVFDSELIDRVLGFPSLAIGQVGGVVRVGAVERVHDDVD